MYTTTALCNSLSQLWFVLFRKGVAGCTALLELHVLPFLHVSYG